MRKFLCLPLAFGLLFDYGTVRADTWQPAPGLAQVAIWPGAAPDAVPVSQAEAIERAQGHGGWLRASHVSQPT